MSEQQISEGAEGQVVPEVEEEQTGGWFGTLLGMGNAAMETVTGAASAVAGVAKGAWDFNTTKSTDMASDPAVKEAIKKVATEDKIPNQDIIYEQLAHNLAYGRYDMAQLTAWGYGPPRVVIPLNPLTGMFVVAVEPAKLPPEQQAAIEEMHGAPLRTVLAFRGSTDAVDWADDASPEGIGMFHFSMHQADIAAGIAKYSKNGPPDVTGHSLGGALAQLAATVGDVGRIVTFQAPGIPADKAAALSEKGVQATHHRAAEDAVAWAGGEHVAGQEFIYDQVGSIPGASHTNFLLGGLNDLRGGVVPDVQNSDVFNGREDYEMTDPFAMGRDPAKQAEFEEDKAAGHMALTWVSEGAADWNMNGETDWYEDAYKEGREGFAELVRWGAGTTARMGDDMLESLDGAAAQDHGLVGDALGWLWETGRETIYDGDVTGLMGDGGNLLTQHESMSASGNDMELCIAVWDAIEPRVGTVPPAVLIAEIQRAGIEDPRLEQQLVNQVNLGSGVDFQDYWDRPDVEAYA